MDIVITYVDCTDPSWQAEYSSHCRKPILKKRYRDWGTLKYLFRGIAENMPFVNHVFLVVSGPTQVPEWVDRSQVHIVLHRDIIPGKFLPTFNSTAIEMFLHNIPGLGEEFLYFNDDMFPVMPCRPEDFFRNGKGVIRLKRCFLSPDMYKKQCRNSDRLSRKALGKKPSCHFLRPQHICSPFFKSECFELFAAEKENILSSITAVRENKNLSQYVYIDYLYYKGKILDETISKKHFSTAVSSEQKISRFIEHPDRKMVCINDVEMNDEKFQRFRTRIVSAFEKKFPVKSRFEK